MTRDHRLLAAITGFIASFLIAFEYRRVALGRSFQWSNVGDPCVEKVSPEMAFSCFKPLAATNYEISLFLLMILLILVSAGVVLSAKVGLERKLRVATACFVTSHLLAYEAWRVTFMREFERTILGTPCERAKKELDVAFNCFGPDRATIYEYALALFSVLLIVGSVALIGWVYFSSPKQEEQ